MSERSKAVLIDCDTLSDEDFERVMAEERAFWKSFGSTQSQRHSFLDAMRALIVEILRNGRFHILALHMVVGEYTDRLSLNSLKQIMAANAEWAWEETSPDVWGLTDGVSPLVHGTYEGTRSDDRLTNARITQTLRQGIADGWIMRVGHKFQRVPDHPLPEPNSPATRSQPPAL